MRKLASVQEILEVKDHLNADRLDILKVLGWQVISRKGEFKRGDKCIYFEIDSLIPIKSWSKFLEKKEKPGRSVRLRSIRLRKELSQGLVVPLDILEEYVGEDYKSYEIGRDLTDTLGIKKYIPSISANLAGKVRGVFPGCVPKTDEQRIQSEPDLIKEFQNELVYWSIKCDGTSGSFIDIEGDHHVCSRNLSLQDDGKNCYWKMYHKYNIKNIFEDNPGYAIQGEICGPGIQGNRMGLEDHELFVFNVYKLNVSDIKGNRFLDYYDFLNFCRVFGLKTVPIEKEEKFNYQTVDELVNIATKCKYPNGDSGEGYVIRPVVERYSPILYSRASFKVINNNYLMEHNE